MKKLTALALLGTALFTTTSSFARTDVSTSAGCGNGNEECRQIRFLHDDHDGIEWSVKMTDQNNITYSCWTHNVSSGDECIFWVKVEKTDEVRYFDFTIDMGKNLEKASRHDKKRFRINAQTEDYDTLYYRAYYRKSKDKTYVKSY